MFTEDWGELQTWEAALTYVRIYRSQQKHWGQTRHRKNFHPWSVLTTALSKIKMRFHLLLQALPWVELGHVLRPCPRGQGHHKEDCQDMLNLGTLRGLRYWSAVRILKEYFQHKKCRHLEICTDGNSISLKSTKSSKDLCFGFKYLKLLCRPWPFIFISDTDVIHSLCILYGKWHNSLLHPVNKNPNRAAKKQKS